MAAVRFSNTPSAKILTALARSRPSTAASRRSTSPGSWARPAPTSRRRAGTAAPGGPPLRGPAGRRPPAGDAGAVEVTLAALDGRLPLGRAGVGGEVGDQG